MVCGKMPRINACLKLTAFKTELFISLTAEPDPQKILHPSVSPLNDCYQRLLKPKPWIPSLIAFSTSFWQSPSPLALSPSSLKTIILLHPSCISFFQVIVIPDVHDHMCLSTDLLLLDLPLTLLPIHFTQSILFQVQIWCCQSLA